MALTSAQRNFLEHHNAFMRFYYSPPSPRMDKDKFELCQGMYQTLKILYNNLSDAEKMPGLFTYIPFLDVE